MTRFFPARLARVLLCVGAALLTTAASAQTFEPQATHTFRSQPLTDRYIVVFKKDVVNPRADAEDAARRAGGRHDRTFSRALKGFSATLSAEALEKLRRDPRVEYIEQDQLITLSGVQDLATWGLDRIDQADRPLNLQYSYNYTGAGVNAFIIDTGIRTSHSEFAGRTLPGYTAVADGNGTEDCNGHGTHVAGTVGGTTWGVAKGVKLIPVRVLDCNGSGTISGVIAGIDWVASNSLRPAVANMSLGGGLSSALNTAVENAVSDGVTMVVAAGNETQDACRTSPASAPSAITVAASTSGDARASFSNFGKCVDLFAPGLSITSSWNTSDNATNTISGTSMAAPHVTGVAALALEANLAASPLAVTSFLLANATPNKLTSIGTGSPNLLLYSVASGSPTEPPPIPIAVKSLSGKMTKVSTGWRGQATITVRNLTTLAVVANVTVTGSFLPGGSGSCVTASTGACTITSAIISNPSTVFTVDGLAGAGMAYSSSQNSATSITINKR
jgi:subtilisin family serine protease